MLSRTRRKANESDASEGVLRNLTTLDRDGEGGRPTGCWLHMISPARDVKRSVHTERHGSCRKTGEAMPVHHVPDGPPHQGRTRKEGLLRTFVLGPKGEGAKSCTACNACPGLVEKRAGPLGLPLLRTLEDLKVNERTARLKSA